MRSIVCTVARESAASSASHTSPIVASGRSQSTRMTRSSASVSTVDGGRAMAHTLAPPRPAVNEFFKRSSFGLDVAAFDEGEAAVDDRVYGGAHVFEAFVVGLAADVAEVDLLHDHSVAERVEHDVPVQVADVGAGLFRVPLRGLAA